VETYLSISNRVIPNELIPRSFSVDWMISYVLFAAFITLSLARFARSGIYQSLIVANVKVQGVASFVRETMPLGKASSFLLLLNYVLSSGAVCYLYLNGNQSINLSHKIWIFAFPAALLFWSLLSFQLARWLTGASGVFDEPIVLKVVGAQILGLVYFFSAVLWLFIPGQEVLFAQLALILFFVESAFRVVKSTTLVLKRGVSWYYIILYFCTLEILPLLMTYLAFTGNLD